MEKDIVKILKVDKITLELKRFPLEKPPGYKFRPGQATEIKKNE